MSTRKRPSEKTGRDFKKFKEAKDSVKRQNYTRRQNLTDDHEIQMSEGGEAALQKHFEECKKNPGHTKFIPVQTFTLNHLPEGHRDKDLYEYIKAVADLTVRIAVKIVSPFRPEFWPNTFDPYPLYNIGENTTSGTGSGMVCGEVVKFTDGYKKTGQKHVKNYIECWYKKCHESNAHCKVWWEFPLITANHVVFDDIEASHTSLRLFFDNNECPKVIVDQVIVSYVNTQRDWCELKCVTCDGHLAAKLDRLCKHFQNVWWTICNKFKKHRNLNKLNFIVSHPHGCCKQVSVGRWKEKHEVDDNLNKFFYTTCTCPGSSGAPVQCVGYEVGDKWWGYQLPHSGTSGSEPNYINYSGAGRVL